MTRTILCSAALLAVMHAGAVAQNSAQLTPDGDCDACQQAPLFPKLHAMLAAHRTQAGYASYGGSCQKGCCQKGCVQKGCVQKGCVQKPCAPKCCAPKCVQKPCAAKCVQKSCVQKPCAPKCSAPKCAQKSCVQKPICAPKCCAPKGCCQKGCCQKGCCQKSCSKGGCCQSRGLLLSLGLFNRGGKCGKGCAPVSYGGGVNTQQAAPGELPTPTINGSVNPFQDDPNPLRAAQLDHG